MKNAWSYEFEVRGGSHDDLQGAVLTHWKNYQGDEKAELPWNTQVSVQQDTVASAMDGSVTTFVARVTIAWQE